MLRISRLINGFLLLATLGFILPSTRVYAEYIQFQEPNYLTYEELKTLSQNPKPKGALKEKLDRFWRTPLISNEAYYSGARPKALQNDQLGEYITVASWNIEKSLHMDHAIELFTSDDEKFKSMVNSEEVKIPSKKYEHINRQRKRLIEADILILQEMEIGVKRSKYWNAAGKLAEALGMNYVYGTQYLEVDPVILGLETIQFEDGTEDKEAEDYYRVDPEKYKGMFGSAVLSRYPIKHVEVRPLDYQPYDWHEGEKQKIGFLEKSRRFGAKTLFKNELTREMKVGGRHYFRVDLDVPGIPNNTLTIINIHLEIKCQPKDRARQMKEILSYMRNIKNPVIMMGDFNAAPTDISPTSVTRVVKRTAKNPSAWLGVALNVAGSQLNAPRVATNIVKNFNDPFAADIKVIAPNPLKEMFTYIKEFRFKDGSVFDFRGNKERSIGEKNEILANSNQRGLKGFVTTFSVKRALTVIGKYRLDWAFVRPLHLIDPENNEASYKLSPHFGETLEEMNTSLIRQVSDHHPNLFNLPLNEPSI